MWGALASKHEPPLVQNCSGQDIIFDDVGKSWKSYSDFHVTYLQNSRWFYNNLYLFNFWPFLYIHTSHKWELYEYSSSGYTSICEGEALVTSVKRLS